MQERILHLMAKIIGVLIFILLISGNSLASESNNLIPIKKNDKLFLVFDFSYRADIYFRNKSDAFKESSNGSAGIGLKYNNIGFKISIYAGSSNFTDNFIQSSGYPEKLLGIRAWGYENQIFYAIKISEKKSILPFVGLSWDRLYENNRDYIHDPHPNWDLNANSNHSFTFGVEFEYNFLDVGIQYKKYQFDNIEYKNGHSYIFTMGINLYRIISGE